MSDILEELVTKFTYDVDDAGLRKYLRGQEKIKKSTKDMIGLNSVLAKGMRRLFFGAGAVMGVNSLINTYRQFDMVQRSLNALTGSAEEGAEHFEFLKRAAFQTSTGIMEVAKAYRGYYYAAKTAGLTNDELQHSFLGVMVGARVLGANKQQVGGAMLALEQMLNKTTVQAQEMNLQLGNAISGAKEMAAEAMGMSVPEFVEKMQKKMINSAEFVRKFGDYMYQTFINRLPEAMKSLDSSVINLQNAWLLFQNEIMKSGFGDELTKLVGNLMQLLLSPEAKSFAQMIGQALNAVGKALSFIVKHFKAILFFWGVSSIIQGIHSLAALRWRILDLATTMNGKLYPAMSSIVTALANMLFYGGGLNPVLKTLGSTALAVGKNFLWITAIAAALYGLYLIIEDIFTYINHPEWDSFTKNLVRDFPIFGEMLQDIQRTFEEIKPDLTELKDLFVKIMEQIAIFLHDSNAIETSIKLIIGVVIILGEALAGVLKTINAIKDSVNPFKKPKGETPEERQQNIKKRNFTIPGGGAGAIIGGTLGSIVAPGAGTAIAIGAGLGGWVGNSLVKTENTEKSVSIGQITIQAKDRSDTEMINLLQKVLGGELDTVYETQYAPATAMVNGLGR